MIYLRYLKRFLRKIYLSFLPILCHVKKRKTCGIEDRDNGLTASQLEEIRKERNRLHAKRTRDKKRVYIKEMKSLKMLLERENHILREHVEMLRDHKRNHPNLPKSITTSRISTLVDKHGL